MPSLNSEQVRVYHEKGYYFPVQALNEKQTTECRARFLDYLAHHRSRLAGLAPRDHYIVLSETHTYLKWVYQIVSHPSVLDVVESILGPNLLVWGSRWFSKMPGDKAYVSWHQDATYWGLRPPNVTTAWIALSESVPGNGCMRVVPETHKGSLLPQRETYSLENVLSRGQEIAVEVDESKAVDLVLRPGELSLHHVAIIHGSNVNLSGKPRIGIAVRYITPDVVQEGPEAPLAILVRGRDDYGHFELMEPPKTNFSTSEGAVPLAVERMMKAVMPAGWKPSNRPPSA